MEILELGAGLFEKGKGTSQRGDETESGKWV